MEIDETYFVIRSGDDGLHVTQLSGAQLLDRIENNYWGDASKRFHAKIPDQDSGHFEERDGDERLLIIRGRIVVPKAREVVVKHELP